MAENVVLEMILKGISALETKEDLDAVKKAVKERRDQLKVERPMYPLHVT
jgi:hypothetical protein